MDDGSTSEPGLRVARVVHATTAEGPGLRTAIWVQGCSIRCPGCINPHLFTSKGGSTVQPMVILEEAKRTDVEGITILGGEPFDQPVAVGALARQAAGLDLGVICFTGYTIESLRSKEAVYLLDRIDLLVDGPFLADMPDTNRALVGSTNQRFIHLSDRYADYQPDGARNRLELRMLPSGQTEVAGLLSSEDLGMLTDLLRTRRVSGRHQSSRGAHD